MSEITTGDTTDHTVGSGPGWFLAADETSRKSKPLAPAAAVEHHPEMYDMEETLSGDDNGIFVSVDYMDMEGNINSAEEELEITVTLDSGAVDHVIATDHLPGSAEIGSVTGSRIGKSFVAANGIPMETFGECILQCRNQDGSTCSSFAVTEVTRPLESVSRMCDQGLEVLFTKTEAKVRDAQTGKFIASYPRRGGLYTRTVKAKGGQRPADRKGKGGGKGGKGKSPFTRPSPKR